MALLTDFEHKLTEASLSPRQAAVKALRDQFEQSEFRGKIGSSQQELFELKFQEDISRAIKLANARSTTESLLQESQRQFPGVVILFNIGTGDDQILNNQAREWLRSEQAQDFVGEYRESAAFIIVGKDMSTRRSLTRAVAYTPPRVLNTVTQGLIGGVDLTGRQAIIGGRYGRSHYELTPLKRNKAS